MTAAPIGAAVLAASPLHPVTPSPALRGNAHQVNELELLLDHDVLGEGCS